MPKSHQNPLILAPRPLKWPSEAFLSVRFRTDGPSGPTGELAETLRAEAARQTVVLQDWLAERLGDAAWFGGATFGWADAAVAPMVNRSILYGMGPPARQRTRQLA